MVNVRFSPNEACAKLRALLSQWQLQFLSVPLPDCRKRGRRRDERIQRGEHKNREDISQLWQRAVMQKILTLFPADACAMMALGTSSTGTFTQRPSPLAAPSTRRVLTGANAIYYEDYLKNPKQLPLEAK